MLRDRFGKLAALAVGGCLLLAPGCAADRAKDALGNEAVATHHAIAVVGDASCDASRQSRTDALSAFDAAISEAADDQGTVMADVLQRNATATMTFRLRHTFATHEVNDTRRKDDLDAQAERFRREALPALFARERIECGSDLIGALAESGEALRSANGERRTLVMASNMLLVGDDLSFRLDRMDDAYVDRALRQLDGTAGDYSGIAVVVIGGAKDPRDVLTGDRLQTVKEFWTRLFDDAGASDVRWLDSLPADADRDVNRGELFPDEA